MPSQPRSPSFLENAGSTPDSQVSTCVLKEPAASSAARNSRTSTRTASAASDRGAGASVNGLLLTASRSTGCRIPPHGRSVLRRPPGQFPQLLDDVAGHRPERRESTRHQPAHAAHVQAQRAAEAARDVESGQPTAAVGRRPVAPRRDRVTSASHPRRWTNRRRRRRWPLRRSCPGRAMPPSFRRPPASPVRRRGSRGRSAVAGEHQQGDVVGAVGAGQIRRAGGRRARRGPTSPRPRRRRSGAASPSSMSAVRLSTRPSVNSTSVAPPRQHAGPLDAPGPGLGGAPSIRLGATGRNSARPSTSSSGGEVPGRGDPQLAGRRVQGREQRRRHALQTQQRPARLQPVDHRARRAAGRPAAPGRR